MLSPGWRASHPADIDQVADWLALTSPAYLAAELRATAAMQDLRPALARVGAELYLRVGELDVACPPAVSREIAALVTGSRLDIVASCGHALLIEDREATIAAVTAALG